MLQKSTKARVLLLAQAATILVFGGVSAASAFGPSSPEERAAARAERAAAEARRAEAAEAQVTPAVAEAEADDADADTAEAEAEGDATEDAAEEELVEQTIYDGVFTAEQAEVGKAVYTANCASCHANSMRGGPGGKRIIASVINTKYADLPLSAYFGFMQSAMPPGQEGSLTDKEYIDTLAYILQTHGAEPGDQELTADYEKLDYIIMGRKPAEEPAEQ